MNTSKTKSRLRNMLCATALLPLLAGCGGGDEFESGGCSILEALTVLCLNTVLTDALGGGSSTDGSTSSGGTTGGSTGGSTGSSGDTGGSSGAAGTSNTVRTRKVFEYEPNNTLDNANPFSFPDRSGAGHVALEIAGSVQDDTDPSDFFIFTPPQSGQYLVYLCMESCSEHPVDNAAYLMVYDQGQTTIASTPIGVDSEKFLTVDLTAGLAYYVEINGYDTVQMPYDYRLVIID